MVQEGARHGFTSKLQAYVGTRGGATAARDGRLRFTQVFEDAPPGVWVHEIDRQLRVVRVSPGELRPFVRSFKRADGTAMALMLMDRLLRDDKGVILGIRTPMIETPP